MLVHVSLHSSANLYCFVWKIFTVNICVNPVNLKFCFPACTFSLLKIFANGVTHSHIEKTNSYIIFFYRLCNLGYIYLFFFSPTDIFDSCVGV